MRPFVAVFALLLGACLGAVVGPASRDPARLQTQPGHPAHPRMRTERATVARQEPWAATAIACADEPMTCAVTTSGELVCWGDNVRSRVPSLPPVALESPTSVTLNERVVDVDISALFCVASSDPGSGEPTWQCSARGPTGQLQTVLAATARARWIAAGGTYACYGTGSGRLWCSGELDHRRRSTYAAAELINAREVVTQAEVEGAAIGSGFACVHTAGGVRCWGFGVGLGVPVHPPDGVEAPGEALNLRGVTQLQAGLGHACAVVAGTRDVYCWGANGFEQAGPQHAGPTIDLPTRYDALSPALLVRTGLNRTCVLNDQQEIVCTRGGGSLAHVDGSHERVSVERVPSASGRVAIRDFCVSHEHGCVLYDDGCVSCWGEHRLHGAAVASGERARAIVPVPGFACGAQ